jgi:hypothetical protein
MATKGKRFDADLWEATGSRRKFLLACTALQTNPEISLEEIKKLKPAPRTEALGDIWERVFHDLNAIIEAHEPTFTNAVADAIQTLTERYDAGRAAGEYPTAEEIRKASKPKVDPLSALRNRAAAAAAS